MQQISSDPVHWSLSISCNYADILIKPLLHNYYFQYSIVNLRFHWSMHWFECDINNSQGSNSTIVHTKLTRWWTLVYAHALKTSTTMATQLRFKQPINFDFVTAIVNNNYAGWPPQVPKILYSLPSILLLAQRLSR